MATCQGRKRSTMYPVITSAALVLLLLAPGQLGVQLPRRGYQVGVPGEGYDIVLPLTIAQCEHFIIYTNFTSYHGGIPFYPDLLLFSEYFLHLSPLLGGCYFDWICNIPAGHSFVVAPFYSQSYTVQNGSSSCLGTVPPFDDLSQHVQFIADEFDSYTQASPAPTGTPTYYPRS